MCGILGLVRAAGAASSTRPLRAATEIVRHRGPDDEGYLLWSGGVPAVFSGSDTSRESRDAHGLREIPREADWRVAFGHRRLSIVDLTPAGHQPMVLNPSGLAVCYNGEIYNHPELRRELERLGHIFRSQSDTEVLLHAWLEWGPDSVRRLNGMFAFVLLDPRGSGTVHAVRDRFGVKPLYCTRLNGVVAFASEIKQLRSLPGFVNRLDEAVARDYLALGLVDHTGRTFDAGVSQVRGGERAEISLCDPALAVRRQRWYDLPDGEPFRGSLHEAAGRLRDLLDDSVRLRLRSDVPVGSCLSGGLDSSAIVCLARRALNECGADAGQVTVTACYEDRRYDEWRFAEQVIERTGARPVRVWPSVERLQSEMDRQLWHLDEPVGSTSQFSQWCVFDGAASAGLKVMLDGQGSDEQLAGYGGNDAPLYTGLLRQGAVAALAAEAWRFHGRHGAWPLAQLILAARNVAPLLDGLLPGRVRVTPSLPDWVCSTASSALEQQPVRDLEDMLRRQLLVTSLPSLLRYEDRNSMAWSVESRVPFLDYRLVEFLGTLPGQMKYRCGVTKVVFRDAMRGVLPEPVRTRTDKMGFVTPEEVWLRTSATEWFREGVIHAADWAPGLINGDRALAMFDNVVAGRTPFSFAVWRVLCLGRWLEMTAGGARLPALAVASG